MEYDYKWKFKRKRFYLRLKDKEKILNTEYYKGRDISNMEFIIVVTFVYILSKSIE